MSILFPIGVSSIAKTSPRLKEQNRASSNRTLLSFGSVSRLFINMANSDGESMRLDLRVLFGIITSWQGLDGMISHRTAIEQQRDKTEYVALIVLGAYLRFVPFDRV